MRRRSTTDERRWIDERGVSELVGFILVFAVIFGSVGLLYMSGFQAMEDYQEHEQQVNAERAMEALADNFNDVLRYDGIEQRQGEVSLRGGQIAVGDSGTKLDIEMEKTNGDSVSISDAVNDGNDLDLGRFTYTSDSRTVAYEGGGLVRGGESGEWSLPLTQPLLSCNGESATITLAQVTSDSQSRQSAGGLELSITETNRTTVVYDEVESVSIDVEDDDTAYKDAWDEILGEDDTWCEFDDGTVVITIVEVDIEY